MQSNSRIFEQCMDLDITYSSTIDNRFSICHLNVAFVVLSLIQVFVHQWTQNSHRLISFIYTFEISPLQQSENIPSDASKEDESEEEKKVDQETKEENDQPVNDDKNKADDTHAADEPSGQ